MEQFHIGFTGTSQDHYITAERKLGLVRSLKDFKETYKDRKLFLHHGDCIGADAIAHGIAQELGIEVILHPPNNWKSRAFCKRAYYINTSKPYLKRNHDIVNDSAVLLAMPKTMTEELRSGTWATVRYARKIDRQVIFV